MDPAIASLLAANVAFVGGHFALSHPLRAPLVSALGEKGFLGLYSVYSLATFAWIVLAFRAIPPGGAMLWDGHGTVPWIIVSLMTIVALVFLFGSLKGNPALPQSTAETVAHAQPTGMFAVTRHPMMWAFAIWAISHILVSPDARTLLTAGGMGVLALVGAHLQDRKKEALQGAAWKGWEAKTSFWPRWSKLGGVSPSLWIAAIVGWVAFTWLHVRFAYVPAGIWRWVG
jgi:uncharacterized membrane protein